MYPPEDIKRQAIENAENMSARMAGMAIFNPMESKDRLPPYLSRMQSEFFELNIKYKALHAMLSKPQPEQVSSQAWDLMEQQLDAMQEYRSTLLARITLALEEM